MPTELRLTALGSSFAAGPSIAPIENLAAGRSYINYAHQIASRLETVSAVKVTLTDLTVSGATILNVLNEPQQCGSVTFPPQLQGLLPNTDIVTFTCGGNDLKYIGSLSHDSMISVLGRRHPMLYGSEEASAPALTQQDLTDRLKRTLDEIHRIAPNARVYLVQYLALIGDCTRPLYDIPLRADKVNHYDQVAQLLAHAYVDAVASRSWAGVVPVAELSRAHALGSEEPWVRGFSAEMLRSGPATYHPKLEGHTGVAEIVTRQILERWKSGW